MEYGQPWVPQRPSALGNQLQTTCAVIAPFLQIRRVALLLDLAHQSRILAIHIAHP